ncbi:UDP-N-acetylmuramoyl-L-alanine--D-glutamate ligase [Candidatus Wolfebacteria bacterium]|nr:UDP-N-acetylmuramoyl-L-alanine--D-glutamate ligase [Candidatus Wolfebacteria bacterium]
MKVAILGFGREGKSTLQYLKKSPKYKNAEIFILDRDPKTAASAKYWASGAIAGKNYLKNLDQFNIVFRSPGIPYNLSEIKRALKKGVEFSSATKLFFEEIGKVVRRGSPLVIGITGTKGKGTTSTILYKILKACGKNVHLAGNIGKPAIEILPRLKKNPIVILELSSFQLQDFNPQSGGPDIAAAVDTFPDHMDVHKNFKEYFDSKTNIAKYQRKVDKIFYFSGNKYSKLIALKSRGKKIAVNEKSANSREWWNSFENKLKIPGEHNLKNAVMAATIAESLGCPNKKILDVVKKFKGNEHRLELARKIMVRQAHHKSAIYFYNDSASTNPQTTAAAVKSFKEPIILIAGGKDKKLNYSPLKKALKESSVKLVILFGENKGKIAKQVKSSKYKTMRVKNLKIAVSLAYKEAKLLAAYYKLPTIIIFSPAAASFDMFKDYKERGEIFKKIVKRLK